MNRFILEVKKLDSLNRVKFNKIVGVFVSLDQAEACMQQADPDVAQVWSITHWSDPAHLWVNHGT